MEAGYPSRLHAAETMRAYVSAPLTPRWSLATLRAAAWAYRSLRSTARRLEEVGVSAEVPAPPALPAGSRRGVQAVLRRTSPTCLERSMVLQKWLLAHGVPCEVVVGVRRDGDGIGAHAWLDVEDGRTETTPYAEIHRLPPR